MPTAPLRYCASPGCPEKTDQSRCPAHQQQKRQHERRFQTGATAYNSARWRRFRARWLDAHPLCVDCAKVKDVTLATVVDHIRPHRNDEALMFDESNVQSLCAHHHGVKTARDVGLGGGGLA